jgi:Mn-dependent DtxR family transcriptional regulator
MGGEQMVEKTYLKVDEVAELLGVSKSYAYKIVQKLNAELNAKGFLTISGRVNKKYFLEKACYGGREEEM